jgi:hypothetical protein
MKELANGKHVYPLKKFHSGIQQRSFVDMGNCSGIDHSIFRENSLADF